MVGAPLFRFSDWRFATTVATDASKDENRRILTPEDLKADGWKPKAAIRQPRVVPGGKYAVVPGMRQPRHREHRTRNRPHHVRSEGNRPHRRHQTLLGRQVVPLRHPGLPIQVRVGAQLLPRSLGKPTVNRFAKNLRFHADFRFQRQNGGSG